MKLTVRKYNSYVFKNEKGVYLAWKENTTHTGHHLHVKETENLDEASVARYLPQKLYKVYGKDFHATKVRIAVHTQELE